MAEHYDLLIKKSTIVDGTGRVAFNGSIGIINEKIAAVGDVKADAERLIEGSGLVVSPGFIDMHSHGDMTILQFPMDESHLMQGITTIVGGNCGFSMAPVRDVWLCNWPLDLSWWHEITPYIYMAEPVEPLDKVNEKLEEKTGWTISWKTFEGFLRIVEQLGISINYVPLVGHNTVRAAVMGEDYKRKARLSEIKQMSKLIDEAMRSGAFGLSTGLDYAPGAFADRSEIVKLLETTRKYNGLYATHWRNILIGNRVEGLNEAVVICKRAKVPLQISHIMPAYRIDPPASDILSKASAEATLEIVNRAMIEGLDVTFDLIPTEVGGIFSLPNLASFLGPWLIKLGSKEKLAENLKIKEFREEVKEVIKSGKYMFFDPLRDPYWMKHIEILVCKNRCYRKKTIDDIARMKKEDPLDVLLDVLIEDPDTKIRRFGFTHEKSIIVFLKHPAAMIGSDTYAFDTSWQIDYPVSAHILPHPNTYGCYARYISRYVKELKVLSLEEAIRKATYLPAQKLGLKDRGVITKGAYADIVVFDLDKVKEKGDWIEPRKSPTGILYVLVNGKIVYERGAHTGVRYGKVLKKNK